MIGSNYNYKNLGKQLIESEIQEPEEISKSKLTSNPYANFQNFIEHQDQKYGVDKTNMCTTGSVPQESTIMQSLFNKSQGQSNMKKPIKDPNQPIDFNAGMKPTIICSNLNAGQENKVGQESLMIGNFQWVGTSDGKKFAVESKETNETE